MPLPTPRLDDRSFQDLVDDAKRFIQERCPEWTDHNVSDPGITLVESFAWMTDLVLYRLNRVPDRLYVKFLDLIGTPLFPPTAAQVLVDFRLSAAQDVAIRVPRGTEVATRRTPEETPVSFATVHDLEIVPSSVVLVGSSTEQGQIVDRTNTLGMAGFPPFSEVPEVGDSLIVAFEAAIPQHLVRLDVRCSRGEGHGIDLRRPPLRWEAWTAEGWSACDVLLDETGGFNRSGAVELALPDGHQIADLGGVAGGLVRCTVVHSEGIPAYQASPSIENLTGATIGAATEAVNASFIDNELLGTSTGIAGQEFFLEHHPVVPSDEPFTIVEYRPPLTEEVAVEGGDLPREETEDWERHVWTVANNFADATADDRVFTLDRATGTVRFGPMIREPDGSVKQYGAIPAKGAVLEVPHYRHSGGRRGNVAAHSVAVLKSSIPLVHGVDNRRPARGGSDGETVEEAKRRGPIQLRTRNRAVTIEDFEELTREAAPDVRRVRCVTDDEGDDPAAVRVLVVPSVASDDGRIRLDELLPSDESLEAIRRDLDRRRLVGTRVRVEAPQYVGVRIRARILVEEHADSTLVREAALDALYRYFNPIIGGSKGRGWDFGRAVRTGEAYSVVQGVAGVDVVEHLDLVSVSLDTGEIEDTDGTVELYPNELVLSDNHEVDVVDR